MPSVDAVLLLCVGLTLLGIIASGIAWRRGNRGRVVQGVGLSLAPIALYLSGLLGLFWNGVVAVGAWAAALVFSPLVWAGLALLGLCLVLWVVGGLLARRRAPTPSVRAGAKTSATSGAGGTPALPAKGHSGRAPAGQQTEVDPELAEIEALLRSRGIE